MKKLAAMVFLLVSAPAFAHGPHVHSTKITSQRPPKNAQVIAARSGAELKKAMKRFSAALGVKCERCHDEDFASDQRPEKQAARVFFRAVIEAPKVGRAQALSSLLKALKIDRLQDEPELWELVEDLRRKKP